MDLKISLKSMETVPVLELEGEVDVYTAPKIKSHLIDLITDGKYKIIIDLNNVDFMDSSGLGVLVGGLKRVKPHNGLISLVCTKEPILKIFKITGLTKVFPIHENQSQAFEALQ